MFELVGRDGTAPVLITELPSLLLTAESGSTVGPRTCLQGTVFRGKDYYILERKEKVVFI
jgi:hypothetical protein